MRGTRVASSEFEECWVRWARLRHSLYTPVLGLRSSKRFLFLAPRIPWISHWRCAPILIGALWYLLIPPLAGERGVNSTAPLPYWNKAGTYNSREDCASAKNNMKSMFLRTATGGPQRTLGLLAIERSDCVAADDFRLEAPQASPSSTVQ